ncbi:MAG: anthranilate synthase component II [Litorivicinus sp.]
MILMLDNYDSFTYNLVQYFLELGAQVEVRRNDEVTVDEALALNPKAVVISPGPCTPNEAGISVELIRACAGRLPTLGVCLGHQSMGAAYGATIVRAPTIMHGKTSDIQHDGRGVFAGLKQPLRVTRYHSLVIDPETLPDGFEVSSWSHDEQGQRECIMGIRNEALGLEGVQFHPESILSEQGHDMLNNFLKRA